jgi:hypothetical protein
LAGCRDAFGGAVRERIARYTVQAAVDGTLRAIGQSHVARTAESEVSVVTER